MARLQLVCENDDIGTIPLKTRAMRFGRHPDNDIVVNDDLASRRHCVVEPAKQGGYVVRDLGSRNGTQVNDEKVDIAVLSAGDILRIGGHVFRVEPQAGGASDIFSRQRESGGESRWVAELSRLIDLLPPKSSTEPIRLMDASGGESETLESEGPGPISIRLLLLAASKARATDLHIEPKADGYHARMRVDGSMVQIVSLPKDVGQLATGLIKTACQMKTAGKDAVLEGHFSSIIGERRVDYRASFTPSVHGQKLVIRVLDLRNTPTSIHELGMPPYMLERVDQICQQDAGMLIVCGPTGSGKTTTLYNCMREIDVERRNVITIEDPVEYHLEGITQIPADERRGNTFGSLLRSVLRQDPDVIYVGEIRDDETARTGMQAAMTGHVVFTTLHAKDTIGSVFRLLDLGVEPYLIANSLNLVLAQRLVRVLCEDCKRPAPITPKQTSKLGRFGRGLAETYTATGCAKCLRTGFRGRQAIFELLVMNDDFRDIVLKEPTMQAMRKVIAQEQFTSLKQSGWRLVAEGKTTFNEIEQVIGEL